MYIYSDTYSKLLFIESENKLENFKILDSENNEVLCSVIKEESKDNKFLLTLDASNLKDILIHL